MQMLNVMEIIHKQFPNTPFTLNDVGSKYANSENTRYELIEGQIRNRLRALQEWGLIESKYDTYNNNQLVYRLTDDSDESTSDQVIKTLFSELVRTMTMFVDDKPNALMKAQNELDRGVKINKFLTVSGNNEFPLIDDQTLNRIQLLHENFANQRFSLVEEDKGHSYPLYVFQVRMHSQGFFLSGLKPNGEVGASLKWIYLDDLYEIQTGESFTMPEDQKEFVNNRLVTLTNEELSLLQE